MPSLGVMLLVAFLGPILFGMAVLVGLRLVSDFSGSAGDDLSHLVLTVVGWVLLIVGGVAGFLVLLVSPLGLVLWSIILLVIVEIVVRNRISQQYAFLWVLTVAAQRLVPLAPAIEAFARERWGSFAFRARRLAGMLSAGVPLPDGLQRSPGLVPGEVLPLIRVGYESGALATGLRQAVAARDFRRQLWLSLVGRILYVCGVAVFGTAILIFVMMKIVPSYERIFWDFEVELPAMTRALIELCGLFAEYWFFFSPLFMAIGFVLLHGVLRYMGIVEWELPGISRLTRRLDTATILEALALAAERRRPLPDVVKSLAWSYPNPAIRRRLARVLEDLQAGAPWCESLHARDLIQCADLGILQAAERAGNLPWALREMADSNRRRLGYRLQALVQVLFPPLVIAMGMMVMFIVVSLFLPIITLINQLT
ncbi:MAG: type II secretion system F family protein [Pirellulales bacterium]|nr:type II secretion system F family protein [Pirellulales bacterium]